MDGLPTVLGARLPACYWPAQVMQAHIRSHADVGGACEFVFFPSSKLLDASGQLGYVDAVNAMNKSLQDELQVSC